MRCGHLKMFWQTLRFRLTFWNTAVVLVVVLTTLVGVREGVRRAFLAEFDQLLREDSREIKLATQQFHDKRELLYLLLNSQAEGHGPHRWFVQMFDAQGQLIWASKNTPILAAPAAPFVDQIWVEAPPFRYWQTRIEPSKQTRLLLRVGASLETVDEDVATLTKIMLLAGGGILLLAPLGGYWLASRAIHPLSRIIATTDRLHPADLQERLPLRHTSDELDQLSLTINGLLDRIAAFLVRKRDFVANASHELRSPLAAVRSAVEVALAAPRTNEEYVNLLTDVMEQCAALEDLVNRLLVLAEGTGDILTTPGQRTRLDQVATKAVEMFQGVAETRDITLAVVALEEVMVPGSPYYLRQVVNNLLDNALKFSASGSRVAVEVRADSPGRRALLRITDTGIGIAAEDLPRIFERFYRSNKSRSPDDGPRGHGLGLSICQAIIMALQGEIHVQSTPGQGSCFTVLLPFPNPNKQGAC